MSNYRRMTDAEYELARGVRYSDMEACAADMTARRDHEEARNYGEDAN